MSLTVSEYPYSTNSIDRFSARVEIDHSCNLYLFHDESGTPGGAGIFAHGLLLVPGDRLTDLLRGERECREKAQFRGRIKWTRLTSNKSTPRRRTYLHNLIKWWVSNELSHAAFYSLVINKDAIAKDSPLVDPDINYNYNCKRAVKGALGYCKYHVAAGDLTIQMFSDWKRHAKNLNFPTYIAKETAKDLTDPYRSVKFVSPAHLVGCKTDSESTKLTSLQSVLDFVDVLVGATRSMFDSSLSPSGLQLELLDAVSEITSSIMPLSPAKWNQMKRRMVVNYFPDVGGRITGTFEIPWLSNRRTAAG